MLNQAFLVSSTPQVMSGSFEPVGPSESLDKVFQMMQSRRYMIVPVIKDDQILGILDMESLHQFILVKRAMND